MDKLQLIVNNGVSDNIKKKASLFPNCVTETTDAEGQSKFAVDFDKLRQELSSEVIEGKGERFEFVWPDKKKAILLANSPITATLRPDRNLSKDFDNTQNIYIEGDNLDVLKCLKETYLKQVKVIYIDPPYNTGKDFVYQDNYTESLSEYITKSGEYDDQGNRLVPNMESSGRFHTQWLNSIYPRLKIARDLLKEDGVIFISIDDNEVENLKKVCDEIFGESNFIGQLILKTATDNNPSQINIEHEYMLCYAKSKYAQKNWTRQSEAAGRIIEQYKQLKKQGGSNDEIQKELRKWIKANKDNLPQVAHYNNVDDRGVYSSSSNSSNPHPGGYMFDIIHPKTGKACPKPANGWRWPEKTFWAYDKDGDIEWGVDETTQPHVKKRIETSVEYLRTLIYEDNRATTMMLAELFDGHKIFDNPKPVNVLARILEFVTCEDDIVLDFFSGSASTAHAVMQLNAKDNGKRRFIMVQIPENTDPKSEAYKRGYKTLCQIGEERIRRAGEKIKSETDADIDYGFRVLKLSDSNMLDVYYTPAELKQSDLGLVMDNVKDGRSPEDLLFQVMLELGATLDSSIVIKDIAGKKVYSVADGYLVACFDYQVTDDVVKAIAQMQPQYAVLRDSSLADDSTATNFEQIFKTYSPSTTTKIL